MGKRKPLLIDVDTGVDDALALMLALQLSEIEVKGITVVSGNCPLENATTNTLRVLEQVLLGERGGLQEPPSLPPVAKGAEKPLSGEPLLALEVHGKDGLGNISFLRNEKGFKYPPPQVPASPIPAEDLILQVLAAHPQGEITLVTTGPLTNLALALRKSKETLKRIQQIICMGGAFRVPGNTSPVAEFNLYVDPLSAREVLHSGLPLRFVGLDVTEKVILYRDQLVEWTKQYPQPYNPFILDFTQLCMEFHREFEGFYGMYLHDPLAVAVAVFPNLVQWETLYVDIETKGELTRGMTVVDTRKRRIPKSGVPVEVATSVKTEEVLSLIKKTLFEKDEMMNQCSQSMLTLHPDNEKN